MKGSRATVVGAGIMGLASAWALARRGCRVQVFEQGPVPNPLGSSVDDHRLIRYPYGAEDGYVRMVAEAYAAWDELWRELGERLQAETGTLAFDVGADDWACRSRQSLARCGIPFEVLSPAELVRRHPFLTGDGIAAALYLPSGGALFARRIVAALADHVRRLGVEVNAGRAVRDLDPERAAVTLANGERVAADHLVVAAGPWATRLVPGLAARVTPSRQVVAYLEPPAEFRAAWAAAPMVLGIGLDAGFYAVPPVAGLGLKIGDHRFVLSGDPDRDREAAPAEAAAILAPCRSQFVHFAGYRISAAKTCFYDVEPAERFIVEPLSPTAWLLSGFSGHGFKFGAVLGLRLAQAIAGELNASSLTAWAAGRKGEGNELPLP